jgi:hypothetical protein
MVEFGGSSYVNRVAGTVGPASSPIAGATGGSSPWALFAAGATGAQGADGIMDVVIGAQGFTGVTGAATGNAGGMFFLPNFSSDDGDTNGYFFNNSDDLTGQRWEFFNTDSNDKIVITFGFNTVVNGQSRPAGATILVDEDQHVTVMSVYSGEFIVWVSEEPSIA